MNRLDGGYQGINIIYINGEGPRKPYFHYGNEYATDMAGLTVESCVRHGLDAGFVEIFENHLKDLHLVIRDSGQLTEPSSSLTVQPTFAFPESDENDTKIWRRLLIVSNSELREREAMLRESLISLDIPIASDEKLLGVAMDWIFYEKAVVALNNSCYMQRTYGKYIPDFNGQSEHYRAENTLSTVYMRQHDGTSGKIEDDRISLEQGFGLMMLHNSFLAHEIIERAVQASWCAEHIRDNHFPGAYRSENIADRLNAIKPDTEVRKRLAEFAIRNFDPTLA